MPMPATNRLHAIFGGSRQGYAALRQARLKPGVCTSFYDTLCVAADNRSQTGPASNLI